MHGLKPDFNDEGVFSPRSQNGLGTRSLNKPEKNFPLLKFPVVTLIHACAVLGFLLLEGVRSLQRLQTSGDVFKLREDEVPVAIVLRTMLVAFEGINHIRELERERQES
jgi:hypothetical protein